MFMPGDQVEIELRYTELLVPTDGSRERLSLLLLGRAIPPSRSPSAPLEDHWVKSPYLHQGNNPTSALHISARISAGVPIQDLSCPSHPISRNGRTPSIAQAVSGRCGYVSGKSRLYPAYRLSGDQIASGLILYQGEDENFFLYMAQPPERITNADIPAREYIFVVDVAIRNWTQA